MRVWTVSEPKAGTLTQCLGIAKHLDSTPRSIMVDSKLPRWRIRLASPYRSLDDAAPDAIISCGRMAERHVLSLAHRFRTKRPLLVHLQTPNRGTARHFDRVFVSRHDWSSEMGGDQRYRPMTGVPHRVDHVALAERRTDAREKLGIAERKCLTVLIGGTNPAYAFDDRTIAALLEVIGKHESEGWKIAITTSRRSEPQLLDALVQRQSANVLVWDRKGENPFLDYLAAADSFVVTKDTVTMHCEALASGRPVYSFDLSHKPGSTLEKFERFHRDMSETLQLTRLYRGEIAPYSYTPPNESMRIAGLIRDAVGR